MSPRRKLSLADIADARAYERERESFRARVIDLKARRRVGVGPYITLAFENRETVRFQIQEMARVERIFTDEAIQTELDIYNSMIPEPGQLTATMFIELTSEPLLREWLPKLVGIERSLQIDVADGSTVRAVVDEQHDAQLTRADITSTVHYVRFEFSSAQVAAFTRGATLVIDHPAYRNEVFFRVVGQFGEQELVLRKRRVGGQQQRVAVGCRLCGGIGGDDLVGAGAVFDEDRLSPEGAECLRKAAREHIDRSAGRIRNDEFDRPRWKGLCAGAAAHEDGGSGGDSEECAPGEGFDHGNLHWLNFSRHCRPVGRYP